MRNEGQFGYLPNSNHNDPHFPQDGLSDANVSCDVNSLATSRSNVKFASKIHFCILGLLKSRSDRFKDHGIYVLWYFGKSTP